MAHKAKATTAVKQNKKILTSDAFVKAFRAAV